MLGTMVLWFTLYIQNNKRCHNPDNSHSCELYDSCDSWNLKFTFSEPLDKIVDVFQYSKVGVLRPAIAEQQGADSARSPYP